MCFICSGLEKGNMTPWEAKSNLVEMSMTLSVEHFEEVIKKIDEYITENYGNYCDFCSCSPCDCDWGQE
jgi:hypothetical protein